MVNNASNLFSTNYIFHGSSVIKSIQQNEKYLTLNNNNYYEEK